MEKCFDNNKKVVLYAYRYMWLFEDNDNMCVKILCGTNLEHADFIRMLVSDEKVVKACRVYLHEIDLANIEHYEDIFELNKEEKENKEN